MIIVEYIYVNGVKKRISSNHHTLGEVVSIVTTLTPFNIPAEAVGEGGIIEYSDPYGGTARIWEVSDEKSDHS